jgi:PAS domain S-box-containing protein
MSYFIGFQADVNQWATGSIPQSFPMVPSLPDDYSRPGSSAASLVSSNQSSFSSDQDDEAVDPLEILHGLWSESMGSPEGEELRRLESLLVDRTDDFVHVFSVKGALLYASASCTRLMGFTPEELVGQPVSALCHPADIAPVLRELRNAATNPTGRVELLYRLVTKNDPSKSVWVDARGKLFVDQRKGRKSVILIGRPTQLYQLPWTDLSAAAGLGDIEL